MIEPLKILDTFAGIGGFSYAAHELVGGFQTKQFVEIDPFCQKVLKKHFPNVPCHDDIKTFTAYPRQYDVITAGFPCQDISVAGKRKGITFCDATSAIYSQKLEWDKLDVTTFSWQKSMGGEGGHGMLIMSPKAIERLKKFNPERPLPKLFRLIKDEELIDGIYEGKTINTPSMLCVVDALDSLLWIKDLGGWEKTYKKSLSNFEIISNWYNTKDWISNFVKDKKIQSNSSICLEITDNKFLKLDSQKKWSFIQKMCSILENNNAAFDIKGHRDAPPGLRIWCGPTVEEDDLKAALPWLDWSYEIVRSEFFN